MKHESLCEILLYLTLLKSGKRNLHITYISVLPSANSYFEHIDPWLGTSKIDNELDIIRKS